MANKIVVCSEEANELDEFGFIVVDRKAIHSIKNECPHSKAKTLFKSVYLKDVIDFYINKNEH